MMTDDQAFEFVEKWANEPYLVGGKTPIHRITFWTGLMQLLYWVVTSILELKRHDNN